VSVDECQATIDTFFSTYPDLKLFLDSCKKRVRSPGWLCNMFGAYRRFPHTTNKSTLAAYEREAMNAPIQGGVAYAMSLAARNILDYRKKQGMRFELTLQIHDALKLHVPASELDEVVRPDGALKISMITEVPLRPRNLDGVRLPGADVYYFGSSIDVYGHWGQVAPVSRFLRNKNLSPTLGGWERVRPGIWSHEEFEGRVWSEAKNGLIEVPNKER